MNRIIKFIKSEPVLSVAAILAAGSAFIVVPDAKYLGYCNFEVLGILFCLMLVVAGFKYCNVFELLSQKLGRAIKSEKYMIFCLTMVCFFSSALITNDVALITFVPFTIALLANQGAKSIIFAVTMETVAANLGSVITPIGNPQNLFLYSFYSMSISGFFAAVLPLGVICLLIICAIVLLRKNAPLKASVTCEHAPLMAKPLVMYVILFAACIMSVLKIVPWYVLVVICVICVCVHKPALFKEADYILLITFVCFFIFVGNIARIDYVRIAISKLIDGRELALSALLSQLISNVPVSAMLATFTQNSRGLLIGCNIGGLGTLIASMASLISYRQICKTDTVSTGAYLAYFTCVNVVLLIALLCIYSC